MLGSFGPDLRIRAATLKSIREKLVLLSGISPSSENLVLSCLTITGKVTGWFYMSHLHKPGSQHTAAAVC